jgi:hypothetical protein
MPDSLPLKPGIISTTFGAKISKLEEKVTDTCVWVESLLMRYANGRKQDWYVFLFQHR